MIVLVPCTAHHRKSLSTLSGWSEIAARITGSPPPPFSLYCNENRHQLWVCGEDWAKTWARKNFPFFYPRKREEPKAMGCVYRIVIFRESFFNPWNRAQKQATLASRVLFRASRLCSFASPGDDSSRKSETTTSWNKTWVLQLNSFFGPHTEYSSILFKLSSRKPISLQNYRGGFGN